MAECITKEKMRAKEALQVKCELWKYSPAWMPGIASSKQSCPYMLPMHASNLPCIQKYWQGLNASGSHGRQDAGPSAARKAILPKPGTVINPEPLLGASALQNGLAGSWSHDACVGVWEVMKFLAMQSCDAARDMANIFTESQLPHLNPYKKEALSASFE